MAYGDGMAEQAAQKIRGRHQQIEDAVNPPKKKAKPKKTKPGPRPAAEKPKKKKKKVYGSGTSFGGPTQANKLGKNNAKRHNYK